jgi:hypothetical protein
MNLVLNINRFMIANTYFLETKRNIIVDGNFTKMIYSNDLFSMNGVYFLFPIDINSLDRIANKYIIKFNPYGRKNQAVIKEFVKLELRVLEYYKQMYGCSCKIVNSLSKQMFSGSMKTYRDYSIDLNNTTEDTNKTARFVLKVSGVWETKDDIGLTFKLFQVIDDCVA